MTSKAHERRAVLELAEEQYKFGRGPLLCRVVHVIAPVVFDEVLWWHVQAECASGTRDNHGGWQDREVYVVDAAVSGRSGFGRPLRGGDRP